MKNTIIVNRGEKTFEIPAMMDAPIPVYEAYLDYSEVGLRIAKQNEENKKNNVDTTSIEHVQESMRVQKEQLSTIKNLDEAFRSTTDGWDEFTKNASLRELATIFKSWQYKSNESIKKEKDAFKASDEDFLSQN